MSLASPPRDTIAALLAQQRFAVLSTRQADGQPYASLVAFCAVPDLRRLVFCTLRSTRKFANLEADGRVGLLIDNRSNHETDLQQAMAVTALGPCAEAHGAESRALADSFLARHPTMAEFVESPACAVMKVEVRSYFMVTRFQSVIELQVSPA
jgi:heme iron utilization protein